MTTVHRRRPSVFVRCGSSRVEERDATIRRARRERPISAASRLAGLLAAIVLRRLALMLAALEMLLRRGGAVCVEARRG